MKSITFDCPQCKRLQVLSLNDEHKELEFPCASCNHPIHLKNLDQTTIDVCPACNCNKLHQHKDFNKKIGIGLFIVGAIFAPWTYYGSLIAALAIDAALYPFFPWMNACYQCESEMRGWPKNPSLDRFNHEIAAHYEYRKN
jgi:hypothetical protein